MNLYLGLPHGQRDRVVGGGQLVEDECGNRCGTDRVGRNNPQPDSCRLAAIKNDLLRLLDGIQTRNLTVGRVAILGVLTRGRECLTCAAIGRLRRGSFCDVCD